MVKSTICTIKYAMLGKVNLERVKDFPYMMAVQGGIIQEVYKVTE